LPPPASNPPTALRPFQPADFETLFRIDQECFPRGIAYSRRTLRLFLALSGADCQVAEQAGEIAGFIISHAAGTRGQIITLDVLATHRRAGIGTLLLREAESRMRQAGALEITLETATNNVPAVAFWGKHGYRTDAVLKNYYAAGLDAFQMRKALARDA